MLLIFWQQWIARCAATVCPQSPASRVVEIGIVVYCVVTIGYVATQIVKEIFKRK
ncbi:MAG TPA: hypothetical protein VL494_06995 [Steroidobacteraceae bacterium]|jgi:hypothetical protein|nr:hypothetical protein [Steroidobacteraceae bacterium]